MDGPLDFMAKLAALVPKPRTNLSGPPLCPSWVQARFHEVLAPNSRYRESVTPLSARKVEPATAEAGSAKCAVGARAPPPRSC
ncbi:hypothetical protein N9383_04515 [Granulosicoccus sp.]|nr:hypothetical protein [Granulosicoccus sp.]